MSAPLRRPYTRNPEPTPWTAPAYRAKDQTECAECHVLFTKVQANQVTCRDECRKLYNRRKARKRHPLSVFDPKPCSECKAMFTPRNSRATTCSEACHKAAARRFAAQGEARRKERLAKVKGKV